MRVNRDFTPEIAHRLEKIKESDLAFLLSQLAEEDADGFELTCWQIKGIEEAERSLAEGRTILHEKVEKWMESWGTENELPMPQCE